MVESGRMGTGMVHDAEELFGSCVYLYCELPRANMPLRSYSAPILSADHLTALGGAAGVGPPTACPQCHHIARSRFKCILLTQLKRMPKRFTPSTGVERQPGELHDMAARVFMKGCWAVGLSRREIPKWRA